MFSRNRKRIADLERRVAALEPSGEPIRIEPGTTVVSAHALAEAVTRYTLKAQARR